MSRAHPALPADVHPFTASGATRPAKDGRTITLCTCGQGRNSPRHRVDREAVAWHELPPKRRTYTPAVTPSLSTAPGMVPLEALPPLAAPPAAVRRDHLALALALDAVLAADTLTASAMVYAVALRGDLGVPRFQEVDRRRRPRPERENAPSPAPPEREALLAPPPPDPAPVYQNGRTHTAPVDPAVARARAATKGIRNDKARALATRAVAAGWTPRRTGDGHLRLEREGLPPIVVSTTMTGDARAWRNLRASAKRAGLDVAGL